MNSKEKLAQAISEAKRKEEEVNQHVIPARTRTLNMMIQNAMNGYYSDYDSPLATPCIQLVKDLREMGLTELVNRAKEGEFDATKEESDAWYEREGKQMIEESGLPKELFGGTEEEKEAKEGVKGWDI